MGVLRLIGLAGLALMISCKPCNRAARYVERAQKVCPQIASIDSLTFVTPVPSVHVQGQISRDSAKVMVLVHDALKKAKTEPIQQVLERLIYERCMEEDTAFINLGDAQVKLWFEGGLLAHEYNRAAGEVITKVAQMQINPVKEVVGRRNMLVALLIGVVIGLVAAVAIGSVVR